MKVFVSRKLPGESLQPLLASGHEVLVSEFDRPLEPAEFLAKAGGADALLTLLSDKLDGEVMDAISRKYTGNAFPMRGPGRIALSIEVDSAQYRKLPFTHSPG